MRNSIQFQSVLDITRHVLCSTGEILLPRNSEANVSELLKYLEKMFVAGGRGTTQYCISD